MLLVSYVNVHILYICIYKEYLYITDMYYTTFFLHSLLTYLIL